MVYAMYGPLDEEIQIVEPTTWQWLSGPKGRGRIAGANGPGTWRRYVPQALKGRDNMPQSLACVLVHIVFSTKNRVRWIAPDVEPELHAYIGGICKNADSMALSVGGTEDHVHILSSLARTRSLSALLQEIKTGSSKWIKTKGPGYAGFHWQDGYSAFSIGRSGVEDVRGYIAGQKEHHRRVSFQDELRAILRKYGVEYDERYIWD